MHPLTPEQIAEITEAIGRDTLINLAQHVTMARRMHPTFATNHEEAMRVVKSEMLEWEAQALLTARPNKSINPNRRDKADREGYQVMATLVRYIEREYIRP
ncbi:hypothetical protein LJC59_00075 [Desulfovibrio sp. OttesenSCG-928-A18]|nr:hypothetical protein [Desulfovibrio sp. OttesenSCG-928-A18]